MQEVAVSWEIKVWHEAAGDHTRLTIEAGEEVPDEVISAVAGSYWFEEVQYADTVWEEDDDVGDAESTGQRLQG